jgi:hypothetical protein
MRVRERLVALSLAARLPVRLSVVAGGADGALLAFGHSQRTLAAACCRLLLPLLLTA